MECDLVYKNYFKEMEGWTESKDNRGAFEKMFKFDNFKFAFAFMTMVAMKSEQINHHPEWENVYNKVKVTLFTHDTNCLTKLDYDLAVFADDCYSKI